MLRDQTFKSHRVPSLIILCAVRMYLRYPLSYQDIRDLLAERGGDVDRAIVYRWVRKFGPEISKRAHHHRTQSGRSWHVDETYIRMNGTLCDL